MKQCAGCGKRYADAQTHCPSCFARPWLLVPEGQAPAALPEHAMPCTECGLLSAAGTARCPHCGATLRPRLLTLVCWLGIIGGPLGVVYVCYLLLTTQSYGHLLNAVLCVALGYVGWKLLTGAYRAWVLARRLIVLAPVLQLLLILVMLILHDLPYMQFAAVEAGVLFLTIVAAVPLWFLLNSAAVQDYCAVGRPAEVYTPRQAFLEQTGTSRANRIGSAITRHLE